MRARSAKFGVGDWVWYYISRRYMGRSQKWQRNYTGPFLVVDVLSAVNVVIQKSKRAVRLVIHIDKLKAYLGDAPAVWGLVMNRMPPVRACRILRLCWISLAWVLRLALVAQTMDLDKRWKTYRSLLATSPRL